MPMHVDNSSLDAEANFSLVSALVKQLLKVDGAFPEMLRSLNKGRIPQSKLLDVTEGVIEEQPSGLYDAALQTPSGRVVLRNAQRTDRPDSIADVSPTGPGILDTASEEDLLGKLDELRTDAPSQLICRVEFCHFDEAQQEKLLLHLWNYISCHKYSNDPDVLLAVGSAIRKYVATMPMSELGRLAALLDPAQRVALPIELELEIAKMVYRNFESLPPKPANPEPELAKRLFDLATLYSNPRLLLREKYSAVACLAIGAIVAMRSPLASDVARIAIECPYPWFRELIADDLNSLRDRWSQIDGECVSWLDRVRAQLVDCAQPLHGS